MASCGLVIILKFLFPALAEVPGISLPHQPQVPLQKYLFLPFGAVAMGGAVFVLWERISRGTRRSERSSQKSFAKPRAWGVASAQGAAFS